MKKSLLVLFVVLLSSCATVSNRTDFIFPIQQQKAEYIAAYNATLKSSWHLPYKEIDVATTFGSAHVIVSGPENGAPIVLFHGTDSSSTMWYPNVAALSKEYRIYAIDFPMEAGKSKSDIPNYTNPQIRKFYREVFKSLKLKSMSFVAVSRGGWIAAYLAMDPKIKVDNLILLSPAQTYGGVNKLWKTLQALKLKSFPNRKRLDKFFTNFSSNPDNINQEYKEQFFLANKYGHSKPGLRRMVRFSKEDLAKLTMPILLMIGDNDVINSNKSLINAKLMSPHCDTLTVKNAGHFLSVDQADFVNSAVLNFIHKTDKTHEANAQL